MGKGRGQHERRRQSRAPCRLHGKLAKGRERVRVRILDVSEGGLCLLLSEWLNPKQIFQISIDVPNHATATVKAEIWHVRRETLRGTSNKAWIAGAIVRESDAAYDALLTAAGIERAPGATPAAAARAADTTSGTTSAQSIPAPRAATPATRPRSAPRPTAESAPAPAPVRPDAPPPRPPAIPKAAPAPARASRSSESPDAPDDATIDALESRIYRLRCKQRGSPRTRVLSIGAASEEEARKQAEESLGSGWMLLEVAEA